MADPAPHATPAARTSPDRPGRVVAALGGGALLTALGSAWALIATADDPATYQGAVEDYITQVLAERFPAHLVLLLPLLLAVAAHRRARQAVPAGHGISPDPLVRRGRRAAIVTYWVVGLLLAATPLFWGWIGLSYATG